MIAPPKFSPVHPDGGIDCEMAAEWQFRALADRIEAAGWTAGEAASALLSLALHPIRFREETAADELRISEARKARSHSETAAANRHVMIGSGLGQAIRNLLGHKRMALRS